MLRDYRNWLTSELQLLSNASHHAYSFGQANMAKRAIDELDKELAATLYIGLDATEVRRALTELELLAERETALTPGLRLLRESLRVAIAAAERLPEEVGPSTEEAGPSAEEARPSAEEAGPSAARVLSAEAEAE